MSFSKRFLIFLFLVAVAGAMRFHALGAWSFGFDELFTTIEAKILFNEIPVPNEYLKGKNITPENTQYYRLPRLLCASYCVHRLNYLLFGESEFGSRVLMAVFGSLCVGIIFLLAQPLFGTPGAIILALLMMLMPEHIMQSQCNRFYSQSVLLITIVFLLGGHVSANRSLAAAIWLGPAAVLMVLSNTLGGIIWGVLLGACLANLLRSTVPNIFDTSGKKNKNRSEIPVRIIVIATIWTILLLGIAVFHILPLAGFWNQSSRWGYTPIHAVMSFVNILGWQFFLLGCLGTLLTLAESQKSGNLYWAFCSILCGFAVLLLPLKIVYNPLYGILFAFPFLVTAAMFIEKIYRLIIETKIHFAEIAAVCWVAVCLLLNLPSVVSYYCDGNRPDNRNAFQYVAEHWQHGDRLAGFLMGTAQYYIPECQPRIPLRSYDTVTKLQEILDNNEAGNGRLWIVLQSTRGGLDDELRRWLSRHAVYKTRFGKKRFDYIENNVDVFLVPKNELTTE